MKTESLQLEHMETLLDVVFGVVIAVALTDLPGLARASLADRTPGDFSSVFLLASSLVFSAFYWLEVRHFIEEWHRFNRAIGRVEQDEFDAGVPVPLASFLLGTLLMMTLASGILTFSRSGTFTAFLATSSLFWLSDLGGTMTLKRSYRPLAGAVSRLREQSPKEHAWFLGHLSSQYFSFYGAANALVFLLLLLLDRWLGGSDVYRLVASAFVLVLTLFRHLVWRSRLYVWWARGRQS